MEQSPKNLSKFLGQIVKALSFNNETDKTDYETTIIQPDNVQQGEEALEHTFDNARPNFPASLSSEIPPDTRLLVFRSENAEVRKILFDSMYVTDEGHYITTNRQKDCKFLKDIVVKFAFGDVPLKNPETIRFAKIDQNQYAFAIVFNLPTTTASTNPSPKKPPPTPLFHDSSTDSTSSSGYSSLPILDDQSSNTSSCCTSNSDYGSSGSGTLNPSHSLPTTPSHFHHRVGTGYRCRTNSSRMTLGAVLMFSTNLNISPSLLEPLLFPMQIYISQMYHLRSRSKFPTMLKSYYNSLTLDVENYSNLCKQLLPTCLDILPLFSLKIFAEFISLLVTNPWSKINVICSPKVANSALAIFKICYLIKNFTHNFPQQVNCSPPPPCTPTRNNLLSPNTFNPNTTGANDSGYFSYSTIKSTSICDHNRSEEDDEEEEEGEQLICDNKSTNSSSGGSGDRERRDSFIVEEQEEQRQQPRNKFYLGDEEDDEQTESKLTLSEPMKEKLFPNAIPPKPVISVQEIKLDLGVVNDQQQHQQLQLQQERENIYYLNNSSRFSPFQTYQLFHSAPNYDYIHTITNEILEINFDKLLLRSINLKKVPSEVSKKSIRELVSKTRSLTKLITDTEKTLIFFLVNLVEIIK